MLNLHLKLPPVRSFFDTSNMPEISGCQGGQWLSPWIAVGSTALASACAVSGVENLASAARFSGSDLGSPKKIGEWINGPPWSLRALSMFGSWVFDPIWTPSNTMQFAPCSILTYTYRRIGPKLIITAKVGKVQVPNRCWETQCNFPGGKSLQSQVVPWLKSTGGSTGVLTTIET